MGFDREISVWILEYLLREATDNTMVTQALSIMPVPRESPVLMKTVSLKALELCILDGSVSESILDTLESIAKIYRDDNNDDDGDGDGDGDGLVVLFEGIKLAYCMVAVDCTVRFMEGTTGNGAAGGRYLEAVDRIWRQRIGYLEKSSNVDLISDQLRTWKDDIEAAIYDEQVSRRIINMNTRLEALRAVRSFIAHAWKLMGPTFLEQVAKKMGRWLLVSHNPAGLGNSNPVQVTNTGCMDLPETLVPVLVEMLKAPVLQTAANSPLMAPVVERIHQCEDGSTYCQDGDGSLNPAMQNEDQPDQQNVRDRDQKVEEKTLAVPVPALRHKDVEDSNALPKLKDVAGKSRRSKRGVQIGDDVETSRNGVALLGSAEFRKVQEALESSTPGLKAVVKDPLPAAPSRSAAVIRGIEKTRTIVEPSAETQDRMEVNVPKHSNAQYVEAIRTEEKSIPGTSSRHRNDDTRDASHVDARAPKSVCVKMPDTLVPVLIETREAPVLQTDAKSPIKAPVGNCNHQYGDGSTYCQGRHGSSNAAMQSENLPDQENVRDRDLKVEENILAAVPTLKHKDVKDSNALPKLKHVAGKSKRSKRGVQIGDDVETSRNRVALLGSAEVRKVRKALESSSPGHQAVVKDPLPEALSRSDAVICGIGKTHQNAEPLAETQGRMDVNVPKHSDAQCVEAIRTEEKSIPGTSSSHRNDDTRDANHVNAIALKSGCVEMHDTLPELIEMHEAPVLQIAAKSPHKAPVVNHNHQYKDGSTYCQGRHGSSNIALQSENQPDQRNMRERDLKVEKKILAVHVPTLRHKEVVDSNALPKLKHVAGKFKRRKRGVQIGDAEELTGETLKTRVAQPSSAEVSKVQEALRSSSLGLQAVVQDPLPEALSLADAVICDIGRTPTNAEPSAETQDRMDVNIPNAPARHQNDDTRDASHVDARAPESFVENNSKVLDGTNNNLGTKRSYQEINATNAGLMSRNDTAQTLEWEDVDEGPSSPERLRLPRRKPISVSPLNKYSQPKVVRRRHHGRWSCDEEDTLRMGVEKFGKGSWKMILSFYREIFEVRRRTEVDLKDKWRNMMKYAA